MVPGEKLRGADKVRRIPVKVIPTDAMPRKPDWIRVRIPASPELSRIKGILRERKLASVCEEASCPNLPECFSHGTATFMIMGEICTRRCPFCDVAHGKPLELEADEPRQLAGAIAGMGLRYVVVTSVVGGGLQESGGGHLSECLSGIRRLNKTTTIEVLVPDFRGRMDVAIDILTRTPPDVFNHNLETVPRLYKEAIPGADYQYSLDLLKSFKEKSKNVPTKSGLMLGLGEEMPEVESVMEDLRAHKVDMLTLCQYLQPSGDPLAVQAYIHPEDFDRFAFVGQIMVFKHVACAPIGRSS